VTCERVKPTYFTCFGQIYCPSSEVLILYPQQLVFVVLVTLTVSEVRMEHFHPDLASREGGTQFHPFYFKKDKFLDSFVLCLALNTLQSHFVMDLKHGSTDNI